MTVLTFQKTLFDHLAEAAPEAFPQKDSTAFLNDNFLKVEVFYEDLNSEKTSHEPKYLVNTVNPF